MSGFGGKADHAATRPEVRNCPQRTLTPAVQRSKAARECELIYPKAGECDLGHHAGRVSASPIHGLAAIPCSKAFCGSTCLKAIKFRARWLSHFFEAPRAIYADALRPGWSARACAR